MDAKAVSSGKGSSRRGDAEARRKFEEGWDAVFGRKKPTKVKRQRMKPYPHLVCSPCGSPVSRRDGGWLASWYPGECDVCGNDTTVTEARDFGYPDWPGHETRAQADRRWLKSLSPEERALYESIMGREIC